MFEVRQRISDPALTVCDACGGEVRRLLSPAPFILKGGGWYVTDYPSEARKKAVESEKSSTKSDAAKSDGGSASDKPAAPAPSTTAASGSAPAPAAKSQPKSRKLKSD
jgi:putative FmdB family regulatory protein